MWHVNRDLGRERLLKISSPPIIDDCFCLNWMPALNPNADLSWLLFYFFALPPGSVPRQSKTKLKPNAAYHWFSYSSLRSRPSGGVLGWDFRSNFFPPQSICVGRPGHRTGNFPFFPPWYFFSAPAHLGDFRVSGCFLFYNKKQKNTSPKPGRQRRGPTRIWTVAQKKPVLESFRESIPTVPPSAGMP